MNDVMPVDGLRSAADLDRPARVDRRPLAIAMAITTTFFVVELVGAYISNSLALLADAAHMLTDVAALGLALFAMWLASRATSPERTFGYLRAEILAALVNAVSLIVLAIYIFWEAWQRFQEPPEVKSGPLLVVAVAGMLANIASAWVLSRGGGHRDNLNTRGAFLHVLGDLLGSVATIAAALIIAFTGWYAADPILSVLIGGLVVFGAWSLLRESVDVLLEAAPRGVVDRRRAPGDGCRAGCRGRPRSPRLDGDLRVDRALRARRDRESRQLGDLHDGARHHAARAVRYRPRDVATGAAPFRERPPGIAARSTLPRAAPPV